jgi:hypothetical protein
MPETLVFPRFVTAATFLLCLPVIPVRAATILTDNLSAATSGTESATGSTWITGSFGTNASQYLLDSITLLLANSSTGTAEVDIYDDGGLQPGSLIGVLTPPAVYSTTLAQTIFSGNNILLSANSTYWVVLKATTGQFDWAWTSDNTGTGAGFQNTWGSTDDAGATWFTYDVFPVQFSAEASTAAGAAPEPGTLALCTTGALLGAGAWFSRRLRPRGRKQEETLQW